MVRVETLPQIESPDQTATQCRWNCLSDHCPLHPSGSLFPTGKLCLLGRSLWHSWTNWSVLATTKGYSWKFCAWNKAKRSYSIYISKQFLDNCLPMNIMSKYRATSMWQPVWEHLCENMWKITKSYRLY